METAEKALMVTYDSPEAAHLQAGITGWVSRDGRFWGADEHMARWSGCTHDKCKACGALREKSSYCRPCHDKKMAEKFAAYPVEKWDGEAPLCIFDSDIYFFDADAIYDHLDGLGEDDAEPQICKCKPGYLRMIDSDTWCGDLPDDGELPDEVAAAMDALNEAIKKAGPVCWYGDKIAIDVQDLMKQVGFQPTEQADAATPEAQSS